MIIKDICSDEIDVLSVHVRVDSVNSSDEELPELWFYVYGNYFVGCTPCSAVLKAFRDAWDALEYAQELEKQIQAEKEAVPFT